MTDHDTAPLYRFDPEWGEPVDASLSRPILVVSMEGWVDAGMGASAAIAELLASSPTSPVASFDTELLLDQRARRPVARLEDGITTGLTWPAITLVAGKDRVGADLLYLTGPEPDFRWPTFIRDVVALTRALGVRTVVGLGAFPAPAPHTRPVRLASTVPPQSAGLAGRVGSVHGTLEVPAGVQAAMEVAVGDAGEASRRQVDELIGSNPEHLDMVRRLETAVDAEEVNPLGLDGDVPSGDEIAAELEQFLKNEGH